MNACRLMPWSSAPAIADEHRSRPTPSETIILYAVKNLRPFSITSLPKSQIGRQVLIQFPQPKAV